MNALAEELVMSLEKNILNIIVPFKKVSGFSGEWKQRRIDKCRAGRSGKGRCIAGIPESWI